MGVQGPLCALGPRPLRLAAFQRRFLRAARREPTAALSMPRGAGKSFLAARLAADAIPGLSDTQEIVVCAASVQQGRIVGRFVREMLGESGWDYRDTAQDYTVRRAVAGRRRGAPVKMRVQGSNGKTAMGLVRVPLVIADEPGAWEVNGGTLMHDAIQTAMGKPGSALRAIYIGTLAPATGGWWHELVAGGSRKGVHVTALQGRRERWNDLREAYRVNPLARIAPELRATLRLERDEALADTRLKARYLSYRLNLPTADESTVLLPVEDWEAACARPVAERRGRPIVGVDLGGGRAWSAAVAVWPTGRVEAVAVAPGVPDLIGQEKRDRVPAGLYHALTATGRLVVADGLQVPPVTMLVDLIGQLWGRVDCIVCDRFRLADLVDARPNAPVLPRVTRWSEAAADIRDVRKLATDDGMTVDKDSRALLTASIGVATVKSDDQGNTRLVKNAANTARDDVAAALTLAAGAWARTRRMGPRDCRVAVV